MSKFKQVFPAGAGAFTFRLTLPGGLKFQAEESWDRREDAAFAVDTLKFYVSKKFGLRGSSLLPSLPLAVFFSMLRDCGAHRDNLDEVKYILSHSTKEWLLNGGHETLTEYSNELKSARLGWEEPKDGNV